MTYAYSKYLPLYREINLPKLQRDIVERSGHGTIKYSGWNGPEITAPLASVANAVESAYVLTPREALPKVAHTTVTPSRRMFSFAGDFVPFSTDPDHTSEQARRTAVKWLAIAAYLEVEEKAKEKADAEAAKVAEAAAKNARATRLNDIADLYFGKDFDELGDNKASAVKEIYRLEEKLADEAKDAA